MIGVLQNGEVRCLLLVETVEVFAFGWPGGGVAGSGPGTRGRDRKVAGGILGRDRCPY